MSQATKRNTSNLVSFKSAPRQTNVVVPLDLADELVEMCTLIAYTGGFTYTKKMTAACKAIADWHGPGVRRACLARANERERIEILA